MSKVLLASATAVALFGFSGVGLGVSAAVAAPGDAAVARTGDMTLLPRAIAAIERSTGGKVLEIRASDRGGPGFDAVVATGNSISRVNIHAPFAGVAAISETDRPAWMHDWELRADRRSIMQAKVPLAEAVRKAETMTKAPAVGAELAAPLTGSNDVLAYRIDTVGNDGSPRRVAIDARNDSVIANPDALFKTWSPERLTSTPAH